MKAVFEQIQAGSQESLVFREIELANFDAPYHFHPEYELTLITKGSGLRYVGSRIERFEAGELVLLASNVSHCWINNPSELNESVSATIIQFHPDLLKNTIFSIPEFEKLRRFMEQADSFVIKKHGLEAYLNGFANLDAPSKFLRLVELLNKLIEHPKEKLVKNILPAHNSQERFQLVFMYIIENFRQAISLNTVAEIAKLSPSSFCRFFKKYTGKTLIQVLLDYRLEAASQLLLSSEKRINEIAFECGFEDIPYFNRAFKKWKGESPSSFRKSQNISNHAIFATKSALW